MSAADRLQKTCQQKRGARILRVGRTKTGAGRKSRQKKRGGRRRTHFERSFRGRRQEWPGTGTPVSSRRSGRAKVLRLKMVARRPGAALAERLRAARDVTSREAHSPPWPISRRVIRGGGRVRVAARERGGDGAPRWLEGRLGRKGSQERRGVRRGRGVGRTGSYRKIEKDK